MARKIRADIWVSCKTAVDKRSGHRLDAWSIHKMKYKNKLAEQLKLKKKKQKIKFVNK